MAKLLAAAVIAIIVTPTVVHGEERPNGTPLRLAAAREVSRIAAIRQAPATAPAGAERTRSWAGRHPVLLGALVGFGGGAALAYPMGCRASSDYTCTGIAMFTGELGAGFGAAAGGVVSIFQSK